MAEREAHFFRGVLIGSLLGALAGILLAPKSGKELRSELMEKGEGAFQKAKRTYSDARGKAQAILEDAIRRAEELKREAERQITEARLKAKEILASAEKVTVTEESAEKVKEEEIEI
jgi:gas vesicle protein